MIVRVQLYIYIHGVKETPSIYIYYTYRKGDLLHTKHVNIYEKPTFLKLQLKRF